MKKVLIGFMLTVTCGSVALAQTNFYSNVTNLWYQGYKTNVLAIANTRLAANTNDIAGLILKAEYHFAFLEVDNISNAYLRVIQVGDTITTTNFAKDWQDEISKESILGILENLAENPITPQEIQKEKPKAFLKYKRMTHDSLIEALQKDGYFD
jgi:hypothetical protein